MHPDQEQVRVTRTLRTLPRFFFYVTALFFYDPTNFNTGSTEMLKKIAQSDAGAVLSKSATLKSQKGNPLPRTWKNEGVASLNSEGLPNYVRFIFWFFFSEEEQFPRMVLEHRVSITTRVTKLLQHLRRNHTSCPCRVRRFRTI